MGGKRDVTLGGNVRLEIISSIEFDSGEKERGRLWDGWKGRLHISRKRGIIFILYDGETLVDEMKS